MPCAAVVHIWALRCSVASLRFTARRMLQYNLGALGWQLPPDDMAQLSSIGTQIKYFDGEGEEQANNGRCLLSATVLGCKQTLVFSCVSYHPSGNDQLQPALLQVSSAPMVHSDTMRNCGMSSVLMQSSVCSTSWCRVLFCKFQPCPVLPLTCHSHYECVKQVNS